MSTKRILFACLGLRALTDIVLVILSWRWTASLLTGGSLMIVSLVFYSFLFLAIRDQGFPGRYGRRVELRREPAAFWGIVALLILAQLAISVTIVKLSYT